MNFKLICYIFVFSWYIYSVGLFFCGGVMFGSNVQPKRIVREQRKEPWYCHSCDLENPAYYSKCPKCGDHRPH